MSTPISDVANMAMTTTKAQSISLLRTIATERWVGRRHPGYPGKLVFERPEGLGKPAFAVVGDIESVRDISKIDTSFNYSVGNKTLVVHSFPHVYVDYLANTGLLSRDRAIAVRAAIDNDADDKFAPLLTAGELQAVNSVLSTDIPATIARNHANAIDTIIKHNLRPIFIRGNTYFVDMDNPSFRFEVSRGNTGTIVINGMRDRDTDHAAYRKLIDYATSWDRNFAKVLTPPTPRKNAAPSNDPRQIFRSITSKAAVSQSNAMTVNPAAPTYGGLTRKQVENLMRFFKPKELAASLGMTSMVLHRRIQEGRLKEDDYRRIGEFLRSLDK